MAEQIKIGNSFLTAEISALGAELQSVKNSAGTEFLWNGDPAFWTGRAPVLFPICGTLKNDRYTFEGQEYALEKHGFARFYTFEAQNVKSDGATFALKSGEQTLKEFPFEHTLKITYKVENKTLAVTYEVVNRSGGAMYFSIGSHEAYACPEGIEAYSVVFDKKVTLDSSVLNGNFIEDKTVRLLENDTVFPLKHDYFKTNAQVFKNIDFQKVTLQGGGKEITVEFDGCRYFLLWTKPGANYICLEPWCGVPDPVDADGDITKKEGIIALGAGETWRKTHKITFDEVHG